VAGSSAFHHTHPIITHHINIYASLLWQAENRS